MKTIIKRPRVFSGLARVFDPVRFFFAFLRATEWIGDFANIRLEMQRSVVALQLAVWSRGRAIRILAMVASQATRDNVLVNDMGA